MIQYLLLIVTITIFLDFAQADFLHQKHGLPPADLPRRRTLLPKWGNITQKVDHFDSTNQDVWDMRYSSNGQFYKQDGPIFLMIGGEWPITDDWLLSGQMFDMAVEHKAYMYYTEHRYYGKSYPTSDFSSKNLKFLTSEQALEDIAYFIEEMKFQHSGLNQSKVVVFGGSYAGNLATWMRIKYPQLVHAAVTSSAPILAQVDFKESFEVIQNNLGSKCSAVISRAFDQMLILLKTKEGLLKLRHDFNLCHELDVNETQDVDYFFMMVTSKFKIDLQYGKNDTVQNICNILTQPNIESDYDKLVQYFDQTSCVQSYNMTKFALSDISLTTDYSRPWMYQSCTEFGYFQTTSSPDQPFQNTVPIEMYYKWCTDFFGPEFTAKVLYSGVQHTNQLYGGLKPNVTRVVSVQGTLDPWIALGLQQDLNPLAPVIIVNGTSHCADMYQISDTDSPEMRTAKLKVKDYVTQWLQSANNF